MIESKFPPDVLQLLEKAGWSANRKLESDELTEIVLILKADGYKPSSMIEKFLQSFGNLIIHRTVQEGVDWFDFDASSAAANIYPERIQALSLLINCELSPIGMADCSNTTLLMDPLGRFFADGSGQLLFIGNTTAEALTTLVRGKGRSIYKNLS